MMRCGLGRPLAQTAGDQRAQAARPGSAAQSDTLPFAQLKQGSIGITYVTCECFYGHSWLCLS
jgi:hypothetical protein